MREKVIVHLFEWLILLILSLVFPGDGTAYLAELA